MTNNWNILKCHIEDKNKLNIEFLFHLVQCFKTFWIKKLILLFSFGLLVFVKAEINCECLKCVFCFRNKEKERETFCNNFYSTILLQSCFFSPHSLNWIIIMVMCVPFIIVAFFNELITNKVLLQLFYNICTTFFKIILHKTLQYYPCIAQTTTY